MFILLLAVVGTAHPATANPPTAAEVEKAALDARLAIRTAYVRMKVNTSDLVRPDWSSIGVRTIWVDGNKIRGEIVREQGGDVGIRTLDCLNCEREGYGVTWMHTPGHGASMYAIGTPGKPKFDNVIDPRQLGYLAIFTAVLRPAQSRLDGLIGSADRDDPTIASERLNGTDCWVLHWTRKSGTVVTAWIAPSKGHNVVRIRTEIPSKPDPLIRVQDSDVVPVGKSGLWFPRSVVLEEFAGSKLRSRETVDILEVRLNEPIPPSTFTIAGLNLPENTHVQMPDERQSGYLRNGKIDTNRPETHFQDTTPAEPTPVDPPAKRTNPWLVAACVVCALAAIAVVVFRRRTPSSG